MSNNNGKKAGQTFSFESRGSAFEELMKMAKGAKQKGKLKAALHYYSQAFDQLMREANVYARQKEGAVIDEGKTVNIMPKLFEETQKYLKKDMAAAIISNNMGVLFAKMGAHSDAETFFKQAVELTPDGVENKDPARNLAELKK